MPRSTRRAVLIAFFLNFTIYSNVLWKLIPFPSAPALQIAWDAFGALLLPATTVVALISCGYAPTLPPLKLPSRASDFGKSLAMGVFVALVTVFPVNVIALATAAMVPGADDPSASMVFPSDVFGPLYLAASSALGEEFIFRYLPFAYFSTFGGAALSRVYVPLSALLFATAHWAGGVAIVVAAFLYGCILATIFLGFRNPVTILAAHFSIDWISFAGLPFVHPR